MGGRLRLLPLPIYRYARAADLRLPISQIRVVGGSSHMLRCLMPRARRGHPMPPGWERPLYIPLLHTTQSSSQLHRSRSSLGFRNSYFIRFWLFHSHMLHALLQARRLARIALFRPRTRARVHEAKSATIRSTIRSNTCTCSDHGSDRQRPVNAVNCPSSPQTVWRRVERAVQRRSARHREDRERTSCRSCMNSSV